MYFSTFPTAIVVALALQSRVIAAADDKTKKPTEPCTITSSSGSFYDLRALSAAPVETGKKGSKGARTESWHVRGYDYDANFTMNFCAPVVEPVEDVIGIHDESRWKNVSAYYESKGKIYSIGQVSSNLTIRGKRLVLQYTNGSPCGPDTWKRATIDPDATTTADDEKTTRHKSALISFHCERDPVVQQAPPTFVGTDPDECAYFFEVRSVHACGGAEPTKQGVGPGAVFAIIGMIAILVYFLGGVFYQRNVAHARGWRQLPNYSMWAGIGNFLKDMLIIATSSCAGIIPRRHGYSALSISANGNGTSGRGRSRDDENRLIDQLDEEWDD